MRSSSEKTKNPSLILLYILVLIPVLTMCYFLVLDYSHQQQEEIYKNEQMAKVLAENLDSYLENIKSTLETMASLPEVKNKERAKIEAIFEDLMLTDNQVALYWAADSNKLVAKYPRVTPDNYDSGYIKSIIDKKGYVGEPHIGRNTKLETVNITTLIKDDKGTTIGVIGASLPLEHLRQKLLTKVGKTGFPILVTKSGKFLVHPKRNLISKKIGPDDPITKTIQKGGSGTLDIVAPFDNQEKFFSYVPLKQADWVVLVIQPLSEFHSWTIEFFTRNGVIIILVLFLVVLAAYYLMLFRKREEEAKQLQAEKLSVIGQLAAGMAHEIRNPMTSIKGFAQLAATSKNGLTSEQLNIIINESERIEGIIRETMLLAKPAQIDFKPVDLGKLANEVEILMLPQLNLKNVELIITIEKSLPTVLGEANHLKQVFINLIKNSIDAVPGIGGQILIDIKRVHRKIVITTQDNGCGIPPGVIKKLGNPFITTKDDGTGLGLTVSYRIIQNHGGKISVKSDSRNGTTFTIELPIDR